MSKINILYLTFGKAGGVHWQACFSILSFLSAGWDFGEIVVMTDRPDAYAFLKDRIKIVTIDQAKLTEWGGVTQNLFRPKIKALEACATSAADAAWLYLDADTFLFGDCGYLVSALENGHFLMHKCEGVLAKLKGKTLRQLYLRTKARKVAGIEIRDDAAMWNAGVIGLPAGQSLESIAKVLAVCDQLCSEGIRPRLIEQFSFSVTLPCQGQLLPCERQIGHYWSNKPEWEQAISAFFTDFLLSGGDDEDLKKRVQNFDFQQVPIAKKVRKTKQRLMALLDNGFRDELDFVKRSG